MKLDGAAGPACSVGGFVLCFCATTVTKQNILMQIVHTRLLEPNCVCLKWPKDSHQPQFFHEERGALILMMGSISDYGIWRCPKGLQMERISRLKCRRVRLSSKTPVDQYSKQSLSLSSLHKSCINHVLDKMLL